VRRDDGFGDGVMARVRGVQKITDRGIQLCGGTWIELASHGGFSNKSHGSFLQVMNS
jgi:hypothetical protein